MKSEALYSVQHAMRARQLANTSRQKWAAVQWIIFFAKEYLRG